MSLHEKLNTDLKAAMRARDELRMLVLRSLLSSMNYAEIAKQKKLDDGGVIEVIGREIKQRRESIEAYEKGNRKDLADKEKAEMAVLQEYMPAQMGRDEIVSIVKAVIAEVGAKGPGDKGKVMQKLMPQVKGKADGSEVNNIVTTCWANCEQVLPPVLSLRVKRSNPWIRRRHALRLLRRCAPRNDMQEAGRS